MSIHSSNGSTHPALSGMSLDLRSLESLKGRASTDPKSAVREAAKQLESLFMQELLKSMRATTMDSGMMDNGGTQMGQQMLDGEYASRMAGLPGGLSDAIAKQLERAMGVNASRDAAGPAAAPGQAAAAIAPAAAPGAAASGRTAAAETRRKAAEALASANAGAATRLTPAEAFVKQHRAAAQAAEAETGIPAANILGQAAHETGWGRHQIRNKDGTPSHNLFGIKAGADWKGKVAEVTTTEYVNGVPRRVTAKFRAYDSYEESFKDHARLLKSSPRYAGVVANGDTAREYAQGLQKAGYATDPAYADKLTRVINTALRLQRAVT